MRSSKIRFAVFIAVIVLITLTASYLVGEISIDAIRARVAAMGIWAPVGFIALYALGTVVGMPGVLFTVIGGLLFGRWWGTMINVCGATLGACGAFWVARLLARDYFIAKMEDQKWFRTFNDGLQENGLYYMLFVRLVPLFPFNGLNFGSGVTKISFRDYFVGTAVGMIPGAFVYTNAAAELGASAAEGSFVTPGVILAFVLLGLLALVPVVAKRHLAKKAD